MPDLVQLAEGKTKIIRQEPNDPHKVVIESKPDITAGDGAQHDVIEGKAEAANATTCNVFELLEAAGIWTHYIDRVDTRSFSAMKAEMIPIELVVRRIATGSYLKRNSEAKEGDVFPELVFEMFYKDDSRNDPIIVVDEVEQVMHLHQASEPVTPASLIDTVPLSSLPNYGNVFAMLSELQRMALQTFEVIEEAWADQDVQLVDLKIECGWIFDPDDDTVLAVADVIDNDSWRIWPGGDRSKMLDKQRYREVADSDDPKVKAKEMGRIKDDYNKVAEMTAKFVSDD